MLKKHLRPCSFVLLLALLIGGRAIAQSYTISVTPAAVAAPPPVPPSIPLEYQDTVTVIATAFDSGGKAVVPAPQFTWSPGDKSIASVDGTGSIVALKPGLATVYATTTDPADPTHPATGRIFVNVNPGALKSIAIAGPLTIVVGQSGQFTRSAPTTQKKETSTSVRSPRAVLGVER